MNGIRSRTNTQISTACLAMPGAGISAALAREFAPERHNCALHRLNPDKNPGNITFRKYVMQCRRILMRLMKPQALQGWFARFLRANSGSVSVEFVVWLPLLMVVIAITADASLAFGSRSTILRVIQDTNRAVSIGKITDMTKAEEAIITALADIAPHAVASTTVNEGLITSVVTVPIGDLTTLGLISKIQDFQLTVASQHLSEG